MPAIQPSRIHVGYSGHFWSTYQCIADETHTPEDVVQSDYWAHAASARIFRVNDVLQVRSEDGQWASDLVIEAVMHRAIRVRLLKEWVAEDYLSGDSVSGSATPGGNVLVKYKGPVNKWCIIRASDAQLLKGGLVTKADASREAIEYEKIVG